MEHLKITCFVLLAIMAQMNAQTLFLGGVIRDQAPNTMNEENCGGSPGEANNGNGFAGTDFQLMEDYQDDEYGLAGKECNAANGWYPPNCGAIGPDQTPVYRFTGKSPGNNVRSPASFYKWFHDSNQTRPINYRIPLTLKPRTTVYSHVNNSFFPIDNMGWKDRCLDNSSPPRLHNFAFCLEAHTRFGYRGSEVFQFSGDDDVWVYIDNRLIIDLGSLHPKRTKSIALDTVPGLVEGNNYRLDFFYCERHTTASNMELTTSIEFYCSYYDWCGFCEGTGQGCCNDTIIRTYCNDNDDCTVDTCSVKVSPITNGDAGCVHTPIPCSTTDKCMVAKCNKVGGCTVTPLNCTDNDTCTIDSCNSKTGCKHIQCNGSHCPSECQPKPFTCDDGNPCTTDTIIYVNGSNPNCTNEFNDTLCDDFNVCTNDFCDSKEHTLAKACGHTNITCLPTLCALVAGCDRLNGCIYTPKVCPGADNFCKVSSCDNIAGCIVTDRVCVVKDPYCFVGKCDNVSGTCKQEKVPGFETATNKNGILCILLYNEDVKKAAIGTGAAVGIALGAAAALGVFGYGGKKGYDYIQLMRNQKFGGVLNNPLYEQQNKNADNPLYRYSTTEAAGDAGKV